MFKNNVIQADRYLTIRCRAFSGEGVRENRIMVTADKMVGDEVIEGDVRVWDAVAGHYTSCHTLTPRTIAKIRRTSQP